MARRNSRCTPLRRSPCTARRHHHPPATTRRRPDTTRRRLPHSRRHRLAHLLAPITVPRLTEPQVRRERMENETKREFSPETKTKKQPKKISKGLFESQETSERNGRGENI